MSLQIRRVVTGHDAEAAPSSRSTKSPRTSSPIVPAPRPAWSGRPRAFRSTMTASDDPTSGEFKTTVEGGTVFRIVRYEPGVTPRNHRTDSIDYAVVISGEIDMELDDGVIGEAQGGRRAGAARHDPQLGQPRNRRLRHRLRADQRQAGVGSRQAARRRRMMP